MKKRLLYTLALLFATMQTFAQTYTFDSDNQLTKVVYGNGVTVTYGYDALGNRTSKKVTGATAATYTVTVAVTPANSGTVTGGGTYAKGSAVELKANANTGYRFSKWSDGNTDNPRSVTVNRDMSFTAQFIRSTDDNEDTDISQLDNVIYINPVTTRAGVEITLSVNMKNNVQAEGFGFDLYLPEGIDFVLDEDDFPDVYLSTARTTTRKTNTFEAAILPNGALRVFAASTNGSVINGNDGEVALVNIRVSSDMYPGIYPLILREIAISDTDAQSHDTDYVKTSITIMGTATDIESPNSYSLYNTDGYIYNLQGQRINKPSKGVYIINGKKVVVK